MPKFINDLSLYLLAGGGESSEGRLDEELAIAEEFAGAGGVGGHRFYAIVNERPSGTIVVNAEVVDIEVIQDVTLAICSAEGPITVITCQTMHSTAKQDIACSDAFYPFHLITMLSFHLDMLTFINSVYR